MQTQYANLNGGARETVFFFMLNAYLSARIDTAHESDGDEEVNVYMAFLLESLVDGSFYLEHGEKLATTPDDVFQKVGRDDSDRHKLDVYRSNADHRLIAFGLFDGWGGHRSLYRQATTPDESYLEEAQRFYGWAAAFGGRMPANYRGLATTLEKISADFTTYVDVLGYMGSHYMNLIARLSPGELFHLEREAHEAAVPMIKEQTLDGMLDAYNTWKADPTDGNRLRLKAACDRYSQLDGDFEPVTLCN